MSISHYRGKLITSEEIKGPFTEASDTISEAFRFLSEEITEKSKVSVIKLGLTGTIVVQVGDMFISINEKGEFEIGEGGG